MANPMYGYIAREIETCAQERYGYRLLIGSTYRDRGEGKRASSTTCWRTACAA